MLLVLAVSLLRDFRSSVAGRLGSAFALGSAAHAATSAIGPVLLVTPWHTPLIALSTGNVVVFWLFCRTLFDDAFVLRRWHGLIWVAVTGFSFMNCLWLAPAGFAHLAVVATNLIALGFIGLAVGQTIASWSADLVEGRRTLRIFIVTAAALYGGLNVILQIAVFGDEAAAIANIANSVILVGIVAAITVAMMRVDADDVLTAMPASIVPSRQAVAPQAAGTDQRLIDTLMRLMADERIYRQDNVTIGTLATKLKIPEYRLRRLINQRLGYRNFNVFLNNHRIEEAKAALADPAQAEVPVITIAMDAGFQSLGPFNRAFKATTGVTPTEYRRLRSSAA